MHRRWMEEPEYRKAYEALEGEFGLAKAVLEARNRVGLTQAELARKMGTTQPVLARGPKRQVLRYTLISSESR